MNFLLSRGVPTWKPQHVIANSKSLIFHDREGDTKANIVINLANLIIVRGNVTTNDVHHRLPKQDLPKIFQLIYKQGCEEGGNSSSVNEDLQSSNSTSNSNYVPKIQLCMAKTPQEQALWVEVLSKRVLPQSQSSSNPIMSNLNSNQGQANLNNTNLNNNNGKSSINKSNSHVGHVSKHKRQQYNNSTPSLDQQFSAKSTSSMLGLNNGHQGSSMVDGSNSNIMHGSSMTRSTNNLPSSGPSTHLHNAQQASQRLDSGSQQHNTPNQNRHSPRNTDDRDSRRLNKTPISSTTTNLNNHTPQTSGNYPRDNSRISPVLHNNHLDETIGSIQFPPTYSSHRYTYNTPSGPSGVNGFSHGHSQNSPGSKSLTPGSHYRGRDRDPGSRRVPDRDQPGNETLNYQEEKTLTPESKHNNNFYQGHNQPQTHLNSVHNNHIYHQNHSNHQPSYQNNQPTIIPGQPSQHNLNPPHPSLLQGHHSPSGNIPHNIQRATSSASQYNYQMANGPSPRPRQNRQVWEDNKYDGNGPVV